MSDVAKVTVITPVKDIFFHDLAERFLHCVSSVASQTYPNIDHFVIDGGSEDGTLVLLTTQPTIRYGMCTSENKIEAMNYSMDQVKSDYILFLDADCFLNEDTAIEKMVKTLEENKADFTYGPFVREIPMGGRNIEQPCIHFFFGVSPFLFQTCLFKREIFEKVGRFDVSKERCYDFKFLLAMFLKGYYGVNYGEALVTALCKLPGGDRFKVIQKEKIEIVTDYYKDLPAYSDEKIHNMFEKGRMDPALCQQIFEKLSPTIRKEVEETLKELEEKSNCWRAFFEKGYRQLYIPLQGIGDALTFQAVTKALYKKTGGKILVAHKNKDLFENNPYVELMDVVWENPGILTETVITKIEQAGLEIVFPIYCNVKKNEEGEYCHYYPDCHLIAQTAAVCGINGKIDLKPVIYLTEEEKQYGRFAPKDKKQIAIMSGAVEKFKFWPYFQDVVDALKDEYYFVQIGGLNDKPLKGVSMELQGKVKLRQTASVLYNSDLFVGEIGGLMHMARAVDCPAVIAYSSAEPDYFVNYIANTNVHPKKKCEIFLKYGTVTGTCLHCIENFVCVRSIDPKEVIEAIREKLKNPRPDSLPFETVEVQSAFRKNSIQIFRERHSVRFNLQK